MTRRTRRTRTSSPKMRTASFSHSASKQQKASYRAWLGLSTMRYTHSPGRAPARDKRDSNTEERKRLQKRLTASRFSAAFPYPASKRLLTEVAFCLFNKKPPLKRLFGTNKKATSVKSRLKSGWAKAALKRLVFAAERNVGKKGLSRSRKAFAF